jgi:hypothetical protein
MPDKREARSSSGLKAEGDGDQFMRETKGAAPAVRRAPVGGGNAHFNASSGPWRPCWLDKAQVGRRDAEAPD